MQVGQDIRLNTGEKSTAIANFSDVDASTSLDEFITTLIEKREPETSARDYLRTQKLVHLAQQSIQSGGWAEAADF